MDKGFTKFPNDILEALYQNHFTSLQIRVVMYIVRKVEGFQKKRDTIAVSKMAREMKHKRESISRIVNQLEKMNVLEIERTGKRTGNFMRVREVDEWSPPVTKRLHVTNQSHVTNETSDVCPDCYANRNTGVTHKRNYTKDNIQKKPPISPTEEKRAIGKSFGEMYTEEELQKLTEEGWE